MKLWQEAMSQGDLDGNQNYLGQEYPEHYIFLSNSGDNDSLTESNFRVAKKRLEKLPGVKIVSFNHWACGWVEVILIHKTAKKALDLARKMEDEIKDYPILDEEDFSNLESERRRE